MIGPDQLAVAVREALAAAGLPDAEPTFERPRSPEHGDWSTNVALALAKRAGTPPRAVAERLTSALGRVEGIDAVEVAGPGFVNFRLTPTWLGDTVRAVLAEGDAYGRQQLVPPGRRAQVEFVSANPTGPLHIGAARWAAVGDALANLFDATGWDVSREYYFNDAGEQMERFGASVLAAMRGEDPPEDGYRGSYIGELAEELRGEGLGPEDTEAVTEAAYQSMLRQIQRTLDAFHLHFDSYFGERTLHAVGAIEVAVDRLRGSGHVYEADGATWLRTTTFGDDKDRVLLRADGRPTYFAADCAYLVSKVERGFDLCLYLLGADHHGYVGRLVAIARAMGLEEGRVEVVIGQLVRFVRAGQAVKMSKRTGELVTVDDLLEEVGADAARYTFLRTSIDVGFDFDFADVVRTERDNPVYYVQYSHARIASIMREAAARGVAPGRPEDAPLERLGHPTETELVRRISTWPEVVAYAAEGRAPHRVARFCEELAEAFHRFYTECQVLGDDAGLTRARYHLVAATRQTLVNALGILGVGAPDRM